MKEHTRIRQRFDEGWKFYKGEVNGAEQPGFNDEDWRSLCLPHDWSIEGPFDEQHPAGGDGGYLPTGIGWYRKTFTVSEKWKNDQVFIHFDGVYMNSEVWINGHYLGKYPFGYLGFEYDISTYLDWQGSNVISVKVDNSEQPNSRWYTGSGIYRHTWLVVVDRLHVDLWGVYVTTPHVSEQWATVSMKTTVKNGYEQAVHAVVRSEVIDAEGRSAAVHESFAPIDSGSVFEFAQDVQVAEPKLWSHMQPNLYTLRTTVLLDGTVVDEMTTPFGIRHIEYDKDRGFLLNGQHVKMNGVCIHHDGGSVGAAVPIRVWERRLEKLQQMGCNAIRMSHNPPAPELLDLCDRMGFLVMDESFDEWLISKAKNGDDRYGYSQYFEQWSEHDLTNMLRRDRNHPSIVMWSVGNEIPEQKKAHGHEMLQKLVDICHREDPTRPVTVACDNIDSEPEKTTEAFMKGMDVVGFNYINRWRLRTETFYAPTRQQYPWMKIIGAEHPSVSGIRGEYSLTGPESRSWWRRGPYFTRMINGEKLWKFTKVHDYVAGDFMWTGVDYLGESRWPDKNSSSGVLDLCGFPKDGYYFYQSQWTEKPMVYLFPHWNRKEPIGTIIPVLCYTNCDSAELFVNGKSYGEKKYTFPQQGMSERYGHFEKPVVHANTSDLHLTWDVPYEPGVLKVVGKRDGAIVCEQEIQTSSDPAQIELTVDRAEISADGLDVAHITVRILDNNGVFVPDADCPITFQVEGDGALIGVDNGRPDSHENFKASTRRTFNGLCLAIVQASKQSGTITVIAQCPGLGEGRVTINVQ